MSLSRRFAAATALLCSSMSAVSAQAAARDLPTAERWQDAELAWERGDYVRALTGLETVLRGTDASTFRERIALLTGENWHTSHVADDARAPRFSPDGRRAAYETGQGAARITRVIEMRDGFPLVAELTGSGLVFSADGARVAFLIGQREQTQLMVRDLVSSRDEAVPLSGVVPAQALFHPDGSLFVVAAPVGDVRTRLYRVTPGSAPIRVSRTDSVVAELRMAGDGASLLYGVGGRSPVQIGTGRAFATGPARRQFAIMDVATEAERVITGESPVMSADGSTVAYITRTDGTNRVHTLPVGGNAEATDAYATSDPLTNLALTPDGARITFQQQPREDWELFTVSRTGGAPERVTREIQHDLLPQWLNGNRLLAVVGEARHRRSYLYAG